MNVYCAICGAEFEIMQDLGTVLKVYPSCDCFAKNKSNTDKNTNNNQQPKRTPVAS